MKKKIPLLLSWWVLRWDYNYWLVVLWVYWTPLCMQNEFQKLVWAKKIFSKVSGPFEGSFLKRSGNCLGSKASWIVAQFLAYKPLNFALFTDSFFEKLLLCCLQTLYGCEITSEAGSVLCRSALWDRFGGRFLLFYWLLQSCAKDWVKNRAPK